MTELRTKCECEFDVPTKNQSAQKMRVYISTREDGIE